MSLSKEDIDYIIDKYYDDIYKFCVSRCCNIDDAMDLTQDTFLIFLKKANKLKNVNIKAWLFKVANNQIKKYFAKSKNYMSISLDELNDIPDESPNYDDKINYALAYQKIIEILNDDEIVIFNKLYIEGKSIKTVSEEMNISENNVRVKSHRIRNKGKKVL